MKTNSQGLHFWVKYTLPDEFLYWEIPVKEDSRKKINENLKAFLNFTDIVMYFCCRVIF